MRNIHDSVVSRIYEEYVDIQQWKKQSNLLWMDKRERYVDVENIALTLT